MKYSIHFYLCLLIPFVLVAQSQATITGQYQTHFESVANEALFVHLNKTTYLVGEEIWFKAYLFDKKKTISSNVATNVYVGLYDEDGVQVKQQLYVLKNGFTNGNILLQKSLPSGTYYIKAATHDMMKNKSEHAFIEKINIYGKLRTELSTPSQPQKGFDIQFLPEGGHLVRNVENILGFKAIDHLGKGSYVTGIVYDSIGHEVVSFESNALGIGKFQLPSSNMSSYTIKTTFIDNTVTTQILSDIAPTGIAMQVHNIKNDSINIQLHTNTATLANISSKVYSLFIHKDGLFRTFYLRFNKNKTLDINIPRNQLFNGVNTITLFEGKIPIVERMVFNNKRAKDLSIIAKHKETTQKETTLALFLIKDKPMISNANVSISVLPSLTNSYHPANNIISSFYLKPYIKGVVENPKYYFPNTTQTQKKDLDLLLITQGWSKYDWNDIFKEKTSQKPQQTIAGISISGTVNYPQKEVQAILIHQTKNQEERYISLDENRNFSVSNFYPEVDEKIKFSYIDAKKRLSKPGLYLNYTIKNDNDSIKKGTAIDNAFAKQNQFFQLPTEFFKASSESLDKVVLRGRNRKIERPDPIMQNARETKVDLDVSIRYPLLGDFIQDNGFDVVQNPIKLGTFNIASRRRVRLGIGAASPLVLFDDVPLTNLNILSSLSMANVERVIIDKSGLGYGFRGTAGVIKIYSRKTPLIQKIVNPRESFMISQPPLGFSAAKKYYSPTYALFPQEIYEEFGAIDWKPNVTIPRTGAVEISIKHENLDAITIFIEGISKSGLVISEKRTIQLKPTN